MSRPRGPREDPESGPVPWEERACFLVYIERRPTGVGDHGEGRDDDRWTRYRTVVHHMESGDHLLRPGIAIAAACHWMRTRIGPADADAAPVGSAGIAIERVGLIQPPQTAQAQALIEGGQVFPGFIDARTAFALDIALGTREEARALNAEDGWEVSILALDTATWKVIELGTVSGIDGMAHGPRQVRMVVNCPLAPGTYRLRIDARRVRNGVVSECSREIPLVQIRPGH